ncbi:MAG: Ig-like domain-containing protein, partial [Lachnospiraceae bacterium]|nr:Ig-like domain-containing protein [Lachnospiraceae bacterium]
ADDETEEVTEAAVEEEAAEEEELPAEEDADGRGEGDFIQYKPVYINGQIVKSGTRGHEGEWEYAKGVLTLNNFAIEDSSLIMTSSQYEEYENLSVKEKYQYFTAYKAVKEEYNAGIYCEGDLIICVKGDCSINLAGVDDKEYFGIWAQKDLTIVNYGNKDGTLTVNAGNKNRGGAGIRCDGNLKICPSVLNVDLSEIKKKTFDGILGSITLNAAGTKNSGSAGKGPAIFVDGNMSVLEADVYAVAGDNAAGDSIAVEVKGTLTVNHSRIEATPGATTAADGKTIAIAITEGAKAEDFTLVDAYVAEPKMGLIDEYNGVVRVLQMSGSAHNEKVIIDRGKTYNFCIGGVEVTSENRNKLTDELKPVLKAGTVSYNPVSNILTMEDVEVESFTKDNSCKRAYIYTKTPIKIRGNASISAPENLQVLSAECDGAIDIAGQFSFTSNNLTTIACVKDASLLIDGDDTVLSVKMTGSRVTNYEYAVEADAGFTMKDGSVTVEAAEQEGIYSLTGPISIQGGTLKATGKTYALKSDKEIVLGDDVEVKKPEGGAKGTVTVTELVKGVETEKTYWTIKDGENVANDVELKSAIHALTSVTQADAVYGDPLPAAVVLGGPDDADTVFSYEGTLAKDGSAYGPATDKPTLPGHYRVTATKTKGEESWRGSDEFIINPRPVVAEVTAQDRVYTGDPMVKIATATLTNALKDDDVALDLEETYGEMEDENAGKNKTVKRLFNATLKGETASNYTIDPDQLLVGVTVTITKADWAETTVEQEVEAGQELKDMDLSSYLAEGGSFGELSVKQGEEQLAQATLSGTKLNLKMKEELSRRNVVIEIPVTACTNYNDYTLTITLFPKRDHSPLDPVPANLASVTELHLVKGQKFTLTEKEWTIPNKADKSVVSVNNKGLLKAKKPGTATIQNKEGSRTIKITVTQPSIAKKLKLEVGGADTPIEQNYDQDYLDAYWISSNLDVATVDQNGKVHAVAKGSAKITAYINGMAYKCSVTVSEPTIAEERTLYLNTGAKKSVSIKGMTAWDGGTKDVATAKKKTIIAGEKSGVAVFNTKVGEKTYKLYVIVEDPTLKSIDSEGVKLAQPGKNKFKYNLTIKAGTKAALQFTSVKQPVVFKCTKPETAFVDENGNIRARAAGKAKFTTKINGKTITINVVVTP